MARSRAEAIAVGILLVVINATGVLSQSFSTSGPLLDPCAALAPVKKGDSFTMGLVFIPGQNATAVTEWMAKYAPLGVCGSNITAFLGTSLKATFAVYSMRVDRLLLLQVPYENIVVPMASLSTNYPPTMIMMAFRGAIHSDAVYVASANTTFTVGYGFVQTLSMMLTFASGELTYLNWYGTTCDACGGVSSGICIHQPGTSKVFSCATPIGNCTCAGLGIPSYACYYNSLIFDQCNTGVNVAWLGTDSQKAAFTSGPQIQRLNSLSIVSLYYTIKNYVTEFYNATQASVTAQWNQASGETKKQNVDQNGGVLGRRRELLEDVPVVPDPEWSGLFVWPMAGLEQTG